MDVEEDPSELTPTSEEEIAKSSVGGSVEYQSVKVVFEDGDIVLQRGYEGKEINRVSASQSSIETLSRWFRTVTHQVLRFAKTSGRRNHITLRGKSICQYKVRVGRKNKPFGVIYPDKDNAQGSWYIPLEYCEPSVITNNLCTGCRSLLGVFGLDREELGHYTEDPYPCPECGDELVQIQMEKMRGAIAKHQYGRDPDHCELSDEQVVEWDMSRLLGSNRDDLSLYDYGGDSDPYEYLAEFPESVTDETGIDGNYIQPPLDNKQLLSKTPADYAGVFELTHPDWSQMYIVPYRNWERSLYEPAMESNQNQ